ncbi:MAG: sensor histidine kinase [Lachnospiraceae bacterium]|nr:sensor histidine kinase [Lachnospiraceae bacterium]
MKNKNRFSNLSIQTRLTILFLLTTALIFVVNVYVYVNINQMIGRIEELYSSNVSLNELTDKLTDLHDNMTQYLKTKSTESLEDYYKHEQEYRDLLDALTITTGSSELKYMEKSIKGLSDTYLERAGEAVNAKRGRNVSKYADLYNESTHIYNYLKTSIYSLNNEQFRYSSSNYAGLLKSLKYSEFFCLTILVLVAICNILVIILTTRSITGPLSLLAGRANEVSEGKIEGELLTVESEDEIGVVTRAFNQMLLSLRDYIEQVKENMEKESAMKEKDLRMNAALKEAQLKYLQAQINPHFLFNTLNAGAQLAMLEGADRTNTYIRKMADFFRYNIKKDNELTTIADEIELVDNYVYILNVRFSGEIHFEKNIDDTLIDTEIPSMTLQPLVENAVNYGIRNIDWEGLITLSVYREEDRVCISVKDNGIGMDQDMIDRILSDELVQSEPTGDSNGIGLNNVIARLDLHFNVDNIFNIYSEGENKGTEVIIRIPVD